MRGVCLAYADDLAIAYADENPDEIARLAGRGCEQTTASLARLHLKLGPPKCYNMVMSPGAIVGTVNRRSNMLSRTVGRELAARGRTLADLLATIYWLTCWPVTMGSLPAESEGSVAL